MHIPVAHHVDHSGSQANKACCQAGVKLLGACQRCLPVAGSDLWGPGHRELRQQVDQADVFRHGQVLLGQSVEERLHGDPAECWQRQECLDEELVRIQCSSPHCTEEGGDGIRGGEDDEGAFVDQLPEEAGKAFAEEVGTGGLGEELGERQPREGLREDGVIGNGAIGMPKAVQKEGQEVCVPSFKCTDERQFCFRSILDLKRVRLQWSHKL